MIIDIWNGTDRLASWVADAPPRVGELFFSPPPGMRKFRVTGLVWWFDSEDSLKRSDVRCDVQVESLAE